MVGMIHGITVGAGIHGVHHGRGDLHGPGVQAGAGIGAGDRAGAGDLPGHGDQAGAGARVGAVAQYGVVLTIIIILLIIDLMDDIRIDPDQIGLPIRDLADIALPRLAIRAIQIPLQIFSEEAPRTIIARTLVLQMV